MNGPETQKEERFAKTDLLRSEKYRGESDLIDALMEDGKMYTLKEADTIVNEYRKGRVR